MKDHASTHVIETCAQLVTQLDSSDLDTLMGIQQSADSLRVHALHEFLHPDAGLAASEVMRRAERAIGQVLRSDKGKGLAHKKGFAGKKGMQIFALVDDVDDERFEKALAEARANGNLSRVQVINQLRKTVPGIYKRKYTRLPLPDAARDAGWQLRKVVERIGRIIADDRYSANKVKVDVQLRGHIVYTIDTLTKVLENMTPPSGD